MIPLDKMVGDLAMITVNPNMRTYLSYGGGVNSTAMMLLLLDAGWEFESLYVDHGCDWPETRAYVQMLKDKGYQITVLNPAVNGHGKVFSNLLDYCQDHVMFPCMTRRWCTRHFKIDVLIDYVQTPCFQLIGIDTSESHRAKMSCNDGIENRFPLLEWEIDRKGCVDIIKNHGLPVPMKSGCFICPFQKRSQWKELRRVHPDLFCKAKKLEDAVVAKQISRGKKPYYINKDPLETVVSENQVDMWPDQKPPCNCGL